MLVGPWHGWRLCAVLQADGIGLPGTEDSRFYKTMVVGASCLSPLIASVTIPWDMLAKGQCCQLLCQFWWAHGCSSSDVWNCWCFPWGWLGRMSTKLAAAFYNIDMISTAALLTTLLLGLLVGGFFSRLQAFIPC